MEVLHLNIQEMILTLQKHWSNEGCVLLQSYDVEKGAGTMSPYTFLRSLGPEPWKVAYVEPSRRPADGRYGDNPNRLYQHHQFQVIIKPSPDNIQELYLDSLKALGIDPLEHDIRLSRITGKIRRSAAPGLAGKCGLTAWKSPSLPIFSRSAGLSANRFLWKSHTVLNALLLIFKTKKRL